MTLNWINEGGLRSSLIGSHNKVNDTVLCDDRFRHLTDIGDAPHNVRFGG